MEDRWKRLRENLFRSVEPRVELVLMSEPQGRFKKLLTTETAPGYTARGSHESEGSPEDDIHLNKFLVKKAHKTPLEAVTFTFYVYGITKSLQNQWVRHRIGVGWTFRSTRHVSADQNEFVYCTYDYIDDESKAIALLREDEESAKEAIARFKRKRELGATKQDGRKIMPVFWNTPCYFYCNASSLRYLFSLRLEKDAEWEIRRMSRIMWEIVMKKTPSLFEDFTDLIRGKIKMKQCDKCVGYLFFKPLPNETFSCCDAWGESVKDIDLRSGVSPKIQIHRTDEIPCRRFKQGKSICKTSEEQPFKLHPVREAGEKFLRDALGVE